MPLSASAASTPGYVNFLPIYNTYTSPIFSLSHRYIFRLPLVNPLANLSHQTGNKFGTVGGDTVGCDKVGCDKIGRDKAGGDIVKGNKITIDIRNIIVDPAIIQGPKRTDTSGSVSDDLREGLVNIDGLSDIFSRRALEDIETCTSHRTDAFNKSQGGPRTNPSVILTVLNTATLMDPKIALSDYTKMRNVRREKKANRRCTLRQSRCLQHWTAQPNPSLLLVKGSFRNRLKLKDLVVDMIDLFQKDKSLVAWALQPMGEQSHTSRPVDILKRLVSQILQNSPVLFKEQEASLIVNKIQNTSTVGDWFDVLGASLIGLNRVYLVVDTEAFATEVQDFKWPERFAALFKDLQTRQITTTVKAVFTTYRKSIIREFQNTPGVVIDAALLQRAVRVDPPFIA
ncbi:hypothetical protein BO78DRAFT_436817 [Aspergillus sclerotiicarbonarius CBS 121057]|uniref:Uncharacterized protein n=1 Tax=Aspergillus sclerotiicarbonarius (strain CBS 121057 / IBT 28362) TaxID=1448318 RepID=A0A319EY75_ASPSB|nr:hypothetical protein BO78DRAFT_436817 [Aspergillus sclerotiicarbonarius CBS 121057]